VEQRETVASCAASGSGPAIDRRMAAPPVGGTGSAKEPDRHGSTDLANAPSLPPQAR